MRWCMGTIGIMGMLLVGFVLVYYGENTSSPMLVMADTYYSVEVAKTRQEQERGLGDRDELCEHCALLFLFPEKSIRGFWMKNMRFPIDIIWLVDQTVVHIEREVAYDSPLVYFPPVQANRVIEVNAGEATLVQVGDTIFFNNR